MRRIDAHQHFWQYRPERDTWISEEMAVLQRDFLPEDLAPLLARHGVSGCVAVQADSSTGETRFLLELAEKHTFILGVVGWVDLCAPDLEERLQEGRRHAKLKGFRHILQGEADRAFMLRPDFQRGIGFLQRYGYTYDLLVHADQLRHLPGLAAAFPEQRFVLDHLGKPHIRSGAIDEWAARLRQLAQLPNVHCKLSGLVTEADWTGWTPEGLFPYLEVALDAFGPERLLFGSDWPVCTLAADYGRTVGILEAFLEGQPAEVQEQIFGANALRFYQLNS